MKRYTASIWENKYNQLINNACCLVSIVAAVVLVGCGQSQPTKPQTTKAPDISIHEAAKEGNIEINRTETAALLRKHGGKKGDELKAEGK